jgi:N utilization substance protein B
MLYALESTGSAAHAVIRDFWREAPAEDADERAYADNMVLGVSEGLEQIDERIRAASANWRLERMARVDRNVLRLGAWELLNNAEVPRAVILDEAVEVAKRFGNEDSGAFVNGVLDRIADDCGRQDEGAQEG